MSKNEAPNTEDQSTNNFVATNANTIQFIIITVVIFIALQFIYDKLILNSNFLKVYLEYCTDLAGQLLSFFGVENSIHHAIAAINSQFRTPTGAGFSIDSSSDASLSYFFLIAAILAWPSKWLRKIIALAVGILFVFSLNVLRLAGMLLVDLHLPLYFDLFNIWILPLALVFASLAYFVMWIKISGSHPNKQ